MRLLCARRNIRAICYFLIPLATLSAQSLPKQGSGKEANVSAGVKEETRPEDVLPTFTVNFSEPRAFLGAVSSPAILVPVVCTPVGTVLVAQMAPPSYEIRIVAASLSKESEPVLIDESKVTGFTRVHFLRYSANRSEIVVFAEGKKAADALSSTSPPPDDSRFLLIFDRDGRFKKDILLDVAFEPMSLGILKSGNFVMIGFDRANNLPRVAFIDIDGKLLRYLDIGLETRNQLHKAFAKTATENPEDIVEVLAGQQLVPFGENLLLVSPGSNFPVVEIGDTGVLRSTVVRPPKGAALDWIIPSDTPYWIAQMSLKTADQRSQSLLFAVDPSTGALLRRFEVGSKNMSSGSTVACAVRDSFIALRIDSPSDKAQLMLIEGTY